MCTKIVMVLLLANFLENVFIEAEFEEKKTEATFKGTQIQKLNLQEKDKVQEYNNDGELSKPGIQTDIDLNEGVDTTDPNTYEVVEEEEEEEEEFDPLQNNDIVQKDNVQEYNNDGELSKPGIQTDIDLNEGVDTTDPYTYEVEEEEEEEEEFDPLQKNDIVEKDKVQEYNNDGELSKPGIQTDIDLNEGVDTTDPYTYEVEEEEEEFDPLQNNDIVEKDNVQEYNNDGELSIPGIQTDIDLNEGVDTTDPYSYEVEEEEEEFDPLQKNDIVERGNQKAYDIFSKLEMFPSNVLFDDKDNSQEHTEDYSDTQLQSLVDNIDSNQQSISNYIFPYNTIDITYEDTRELKPEKYTSIRIIPEKQNYIEEKYTSIFNIDDSSSNLHQNEPQTTDSILNGYEVMKKIIIILHDYANLTFNWIIDKINNQIKNIINQV